MTAWHLIDWFCAQMRPQHFKNLSVAFERNIDNVKVFRDFVKEHRMISMGEQIAVSAKHYRIDDRDHRVTTEARSFPLEDGQSACCT